MEQFALLHQYRDIALFLLRAAVTVVFVVHGVWKIQNRKQMAANLGKESAAGFFLFLGITEGLGALGILAGLFTQLAAAGLGFIMLGAIYMKTVEWKVPFTAHDKTGWELDLVILAACILLFLMGGGKIALDRTLFGIF
jgi:uncharacterized membrane protein YphA (DoxX/SURF4 family)